MVNGLHLHGAFLIRQTTERALDYKSSIKQSHMLLHADDAALGAVWFRAQGHFERVVTGDQKR